MTLPTYNGFTGVYRQQIDGWLASSSGRRQPTSCQACGQTEGTIASHFENYIQPYGEHNKEFHLCWLCKFMTHYRFDNPISWDAYRVGIRKGARWHPQFHQGTVQLFENNFLRQPPKSWPKPQMPKQGSLILDELDQLAHAPDISMVWLQPRMQKMNQARKKAGQPITNPMFDKDAVVSAPWTEDQICALQERQFDSSVEPYFCGCGKILEPREDGWYCQCRESVAQRWALLLDLSRVLEWPF